MTTAYGIALWWIICTLFVFACVLAAVIWSRHEAEIQDLARRWRRVVAMGMHHVLAACTRGAVRPGRVAEDPRDQPAASLAGAFLPSPVCVADETVLDGTVIIPRMWFAAWADRAPVRAWSWLALHRQEEAQTAGRAAQRVAEAIRGRRAETAAWKTALSAKRIGEAMRARRSVAAQADLIAGIRDSYAAVTLEGTWDDLVAAISAVVRSAA